MFEGGFSTSDIPFTISEGGVGTLDMVSRGVFFHAMAQRR